MASGDKVLSETQAQGSRLGLGTAIGLLVAAWGAWLASLPLDDNSFLTHLATGRLILQEGTVPSVDPYTFTATGQAWTVQSWLPSVTFAAMERVWGVAGLRVVALAAFTTAALLMWWLTRAASSLLPRVLVMAVGMAIVTPIWTLRPYMVGVLGLMLVLLALEGAIRPWVLVPVAWLWVNSHGSFIFAVLLIGLVLTGRALDRDPIGDGRRVLTACASGTLLGVIGPLGIGGLTFPLFAAERSAFLAEVLEWQAPSFRDFADRAFLVLVVVSLLTLVRNGRWAHLLPAVVFTCAALLAQRNIVLATPVLIAGVSRCLPSVGTLRSSARPRALPALMSLAAVVVLLAAGAAVTAPIGSLERYPQHALSWLGTSGERQRRIAHPVGTGNLLTALDGPQGDVFVDDRFDMFPKDVLDDVLVLTRGGMTWSDALAEHDIGLVLWTRSDPLGSLLAASPEWRILYNDTRWVVACRRLDGC